jgi:hypothetical protein
VTDLVAERCPTCASAVHPGAQWCTLCFADLRPPKPEAQPALPEPVSALSPLAAAAGAAEYRPAATGGLAAGETAPVAPSWPCLRCGESVDIALSACPACGAGFLEAGFGSGSHRVGGRIGTPGKQTQLGIMIGGAGLVCIVILVVLFIAGAML